ncbi:MAG: LITAF-like zinc ribbon domain-containing protein [Planctomycetales bacterium]
MNIEFADDLGDHEYPDDEVEGHDDWCDDDHSQTVSCPVCNEDVYEDSEQCPACGNYITRITTVRPMWWWTAVVLLVLIGLFVFIAAL